MLCVDVKEKVNFKNYFASIANKKYKKVIDETTVFLYEINGKLVIYFPTKFSSDILSQIYNYYIFKWKGSLYLDNFYTYYVYIFIESTNIDKEISGLLYSGRYRNVYLKNKIFDNKIYFRNIIYYKDKIIFGYLYNRNSELRYNHFKSDVLYNLNISKYLDYDVYYDEFSKYSYLFRYVCISKYSIDNYSVKNKIIKIIPVFIVSLSLLLFAIYKGTNSLLFDIILFLYIIFLSFYFSFVKVDINEFKTKYLKYVFVEYDYNYFSRVLKHILLDYYYISKSNSVFQKERMYVIFDKDDIKINDNYRYIIFYKDSNHELLNNDNVMEIQFVNGVNRLDIINKSKYLICMKEFMKLIECYFRNIS